MANLIDFTLSDLVNKVKSKEISSKEITSAYIDRSKQSKKLNTYVEETFDSALKSSEKFDTNPDFKKKTSRNPVSNKRFILYKKCKNNSQ